nr:sugar transferase [Listeria ilorinensis]
MKWKKRGDRYAALVGVLLISPLFLVVALLIKLSDWHSPVIFKQKRVGKDGVPFYMFKFRTMVCNAEQQLEKYLTANEIEGAMFKLKEDPRITKIGKFLRKTSIDELPQLINVIRGEMALVGPRPPLSREVKQYSNYDKQRLTVTPGCTGLWQVSGRNELSFAEMVELDLYYIEQMSFSFDVKIISKTFAVMILSKGAY